MNQDTSQRIGPANATTKVFEGDPMEQVPSWLALLVAFDLIFWSLSGVAYGKLLED